MNVLDVNVLVMSGVGRFSERGTFAEMNSWGGYKTRKPLIVMMKGFFKIGHRPTLPHFTAVPSALAGLTSLFGMGRGGHRRYRHLNILKFLKCLVSSIRYQDRRSSPMYLAT
jgi:hypothetical protein